jgi:molybdenum cofactor synthesis domain-containing protein
MTSKAAILAIGSELINGQILNRNAQVLSQNLFAHNIETALHLSVDDNIHEIRSWLETIEKSSDLIFVTGGLGPTSDDLTRNAIAAWASRELEYDQSSWDHIETMFARLGRTPPKTNEQQCYFPSGSKILINKYGTANGFYLEVRGKHVWVLPGPPREIAGLWKNHISNQLLEQTHSQHFVIDKWRTIGLGESHLAEIIEPLITMVPISVAYRAHAPYVETKLRYDPKSQVQINPVKAAITNALEPWIFETDEEDKAAELVGLLEEAGSSWVYDGATDLFVADLLAESLRRSSIRQGSFSLVSSLESTDDPEVFVQECMGWTADVDIALSVSGFYDDGRWSIGVKRGTHLITNTFPAPYKSRGVDEGQIVKRRNQQAIAALAVKEWLAVLEDNLSH